MVNRSEAEAAAAAAAAAAQKEAEPPSLHEDDRIREKLLIPASALSFDAAHDLLKAIGVADGNASGVELRRGDGKAIGGVAEWVKLAQSHDGPERLAATLKGSKLSLTIRPSEMVFGGAAQCGGSTVSALETLRAAAADAFELPSTNLALTVASQQGLVLHGKHQQPDTTTGTMEYSYASTDVLVVQLSGSSTWSLCHPANLPPSIGATEYEEITLPTSYTAATHQMWNVQSHAWNAAGLPIAEEEVAADKKSWLGACAAANPSGSTDGNIDGSDGNGSDDGGMFINENAGGGPDVHVMNVGDRLYIPHGVLHSGKVSATTAAGDSDDAATTAVLTIALETKGSLFADLLLTAAYTDSPAPMADAHLRAISNMLFGVRSVMDPTADAGLTTLLTPSTARLVEPIPLNWVADAQGNIPPPPPPPPSDAMHEPAKFVDAQALRQRCYSRLVHGPFLDQMVVFQAGQQESGGGAGGDAYDLDALVADLAHPSRLVGALTAIGIKRGKAAAATEQSCPAQ